MQKPKISRNHIYIVVALVMAVLAALIAVNYVQTTVAERTQDNRRMIDVAVPLADMPQGAIVQPGDLAVRSVPAEFAPADAVTPDNHAEFEGRMLRSPARGGAPLSASALVPLNEHFSSLIPQGKVAYTLSVDENNSISGMLVPGDLIDILFVKDKDGDPAAARAGARVLPLLQQVRVLATGTRIGERVAREGQPDGDTQGFSSVTLELDQAQAKSLVIASQVGALRVLLRDAKDRSPGPAEGLSEREWLRSLGVSDVAPGGTTGARGHRIEFIIGGRG
ncbi:MAG: Flp pilus assembly protein CpaB [Lysobacteraceae bacterium SCN 69-48]|jgi:pilus assembly protein CpaB|nr:MAG: Flp pilus assembly protein CpaB [Xanthomonadaceae bacterium SCN 69-48]